MKKEEPKMLLFTRGFNGYSVEPHSVIAWLYHNESPKLAEKFCNSLTRTMKVLEKNWQKDKIIAENKSKESLSKIIEEEPKEEKRKQLPKLKWWQRLIK